MLGAIFDEILADIAQSSNEIILTKTNFLVDHEEVEVFLIFIPTKKGFDKIFEKTNI
jgi:hypothetical protein